MSTLEAYRQPWLTYWKDHVRWEKQHRGAFVVATMSRVDGPFDTFDEAMKHRHATNEQVAGVFRVGDRPRTEQVRL